GHITYGAVSYPAALHYIRFIDPDKGRNGHQLAFVLDHFSFVREIDGWQCDLFPADVIPDIQLRPVADREYADVLPFVDPSVINMPQFRALQLGVPLAELITNGKYPLLGACFLFIPAGAANTGIKAELLYGI